MAVGVAERPVATDPVRRLDAHVFDTGVAEVLGVEVLGVVRPLIPARMIAVRGGLYILSPGRGV